MHVEDFFDYVVNRLDRIEQTITDLLKPVLQSYQHHAGHSSVPLADGSVPPNRFRFDNILHEFPPLEWRLLCLLWDQETVTHQEAIDHLYGHDAEDKDDAYKSVAKRLRCRLLDKNLPIEITMKSGYISLDRGANKDRPLTP